MKIRIYLLFLIVACAFPAIAWTFMKTATSAGGRSASSNTPTNAPGANLQGFGGENIQGFGGENIQGLP